MPTVSGSQLNFAFFERGQAMGKEEKEGGVVIREEQSHFKDEAEGCGEWD